MAISNGGFLGSVNCEKRGGLSNCACLPVALAQAGKKRTPGFTVYLYYKIMRYALDARNYANFMILDMWGDLITKKSHKLSNIKEN